TDRITNQTTSTCRIRRFQPRQRSLVFYTEFCDPEEEIQDFFFPRHPETSPNHRQPPLCSEVLYSIPIFEPTGEV
ncbi:hypothetical protein, partial [Diaphorobacter caeni]|uniref:hypothetical protein n=1 Tax=Diaphorobacter caeni TaxID=2784387 RepID=UPI001E58F492